MQFEQAVILAGGIGERLRPITNNIPKPMAPVSGKPFLEHLIILLKENGIKRFLLLAGYLGGKIEEYFGTGRKWGVEIDYSFESEPLGTGGAIRLAGSKLEERFFLLFGDSYLSVDYKKMANQFIPDKKKAVIAVYDRSDNTGTPFNIALDKKKNIITAYKKRKDNPAGFNYCDAGVIAVRREVINLIKGETPISFEESIYPILIAEKQLGCYIAENRFYDIGTIEGLSVFERYISKRTKK